jgi:ribosomal protein S18 acetylase RimI-like enzyme
MTPLTLADRFGAAAESQSNSISSEVTVRAYRPEDAKDFRELNEAWITRWFALETEDVALLGDPEEHILRRGGQIFVAAAGLQVIGCFALLPTQPGVLRLIRMTVHETYRGRGVGRKLLEHAIAIARASRVDKLVLETSSKLESAVRLYESAGFHRIAPDPGGPSPLSRADIFMEMPLSYG